VLFLTSLTREARDTSLRFKELIRTLSLNEKINGLPIDKTQQQMALESRNPYLPKKDEAK
jgi:pantothenate synthetase